MVSVVAPQVKIKHDKRLVRVDGTLARPINLQEVPEVNAFHQEGWLHLESGMSFAAVVLKAARPHEDANNLARLFSFGNCHGGGINGSFQDEIGVRSLPAHDATIYAYRGGGCCGHITQGNVWPPDQSCLLLFTVSPTGMLNIYKEGRLIGSKQAQPLEKMPRKYLFIGGHPFWETQVWHGTITNVHVWDKEVTWEEMLVAFNETLHEVYPDIVLKVDESALLMAVDDGAYIPLQVKHQAAVDRFIVKGMVKDEDLPEELGMEQEILSIEGGIECFMCRGTGLEKQRFVEEEARAAEEEPRDPEPLGRIRIAGNSHRLMNNTTRPTVDVEAMFEEGGQLYGNVNWPGGYLRAISGRMGSVPEEALGRLPEELGGVLQERPAQWFARDDVGGWKKFDDNIAAVLERTYEEGGQGSQVMLLEHGIVDMDSMKLIADTERELFRVAGTEVSQNHGDQQAADFGVWPAGSMVDYNSDTHALWVPVVVNSFDPATKRYQIRDVVPYQLEDVDMDAVEPSMLRAAAVPEGWGTAQDPASGTFYYFNHVTGVCRFDLPSEDEPDTAATWLFADGKGGWGLYDDSSATLLEVTLRNAMMSFGELKTVLLQGASHQYLVDVGDMKQTNVTTGKVRQVHRMTSLDDLPPEAPIYNDEFTNEPPPEIPEVEPEAHRCWVCAGTGKTSKWLSSFEVQRNDGEEQPCLVCYGDSKYGLSVECSHFYCEICIQFSLEAMLNSGQFPAYCPQCRADAGGTPEAGRITRPALTFLQQRGIITKEFEFRFVTAMRRQDREDEQEYFECPAGCGTYLCVPSQTSFTLCEGRPVARLGQCQCGVIVCPQCKRMVSPDRVNTHVCGDEGGRRAAELAQERAEAEAEAERLRKEEEADNAAAAFAATIGKKCPRCGMFLQKNDGCQWMCCGTRSTGPLLEILRSGGCGFAFDWNTGAECPMSDQCHNSFGDLDGSRKVGRLLLARNVPGHPKCKRPECPYFMTVDALGGPQGKNNGGEYCCDACGRDGSHQVLCHKIRFDEKKGGSTAKSEVKELSDLDKAPVKYFTPFNARHLRLTYPEGQGQSHHFHAQFLAEGERLITAASQKIVFCSRSHDRFWGVEGMQIGNAEDLNFGAPGLQGDGWQIDSDLGEEKCIVGIKTDAGPRLQFTVHFSTDGENWVALV